MFLNLVLNCCKFYLYSGWRGAKEMKQLISKNLIYNASFSPSTDFSGERRGKERQAEEKKKEGKWGGIERSTKGREMLF